MTNKSYGNILMPPSANPWGNVTKADRVLALLEIVVLATCSATIGVFLSAIYFYIANL